MNHVAKFLAVSALSLGAFSAHAEDLTYPLSQNAHHATMSKLAPTQTNVSGVQESPYVYQNGFLVENPKFQRAPGRSVEDVRQEARQEVAKTRRLQTAANIGA